MARTLEGQRIVVVGASSGIGRAFALQAIRDGARVLLSARRVDRLEDLIKEAGGGVAVATDISDPASCQALADRIRDEFEAVDLVVCSAGYSPLRFFHTVTPEDWRRILDINVIGIHQLIRHLLPAAAPGALFAVLSSESTAAPRHALGAYTASKAALELSMRVWRQEAPGARFCTIVVGGTFPTDFGADFDPDVLIPAMEDWARHGVIQEKLMTPEEVAHTMLGTLTSIVDLPDVSVDELVIRSASAVVGSSQHLADDAVERIAELNAPPAQ